MFLCLLAGKSYTCLSFNLHMYTYLRMILIRFVLLVAFTEYVLRLKKRDPDMFRYVIAYQIPYTELQFSAPNNEHGYL